MSITDFHNRLDRTTLRMMEEDRPHALMIEAARGALRHARANNEGLTFPSGSIVNANGCSCESGARGLDCLHTWAWRIWTDAPSQASS